MAIDNNIDNDINAINYIVNDANDVYDDIEMMEDGLPPYPVDDDGIPLFVEDDDEIEVILDQGVIQNAVNNVINAGHNVPAGQDNIIDNFMWLGD